MAGMLSPRAAVCLWLPFFAALAWVGYDLFAAVLVVFAWMTGWGAGRVWDGIVSSPSSAPTPAADDAVPPRR